MNISSFHPLVAIFPPTNSEIFVIAILVLIMFGSKKLPVFARAMAQSLAEFKNASRQFERELQSATQEGAPSQTESPTKGLGSPS